MEQSAHIGEIEAVVHDVGPPPASGDQHVDSVAKRVIEMLDLRARRAGYAREDRGVHSGAIADRERYG
jgi:hypothetical protein